MKSRLVFLSLSLALAACAASQANKVVLPAPPPPGEPGNLAGMDAANIKVAFGTPQFVRKDGGAEIWRYDAENCKAFFFLYPNGASMSVRHVETTPHSASEAADSACLQALMARAKVS